MANERETESWRMKNEERDTVRCEEQASHYEKHLRPLKAPTSKPHCCPRLTSVSFLYIKDHKGKRETKKTRTGNVW